MVACLQVTPKGGIVVTFGKAGNGVALLESLITRWSKYEHLLMTPLFKNGVRFGNECVDGFILVFGRHSTTKEPRGTPILKECYGPHYAIIFLCHKNGFGLLCHECIQSLLRIARWVELAPKGRRVFVERLNRWIVRGECRVG